jgi:hypothetical protein
VLIQAIVAIVRIIMGKWRVVRRAQAAKSPAQNGIHSVQAIAWGKTA